MGAISRLFTLKKSSGMRLRGWLLTQILRAMGCSVGRGLRAEGWPVFRLYPSGNFTIGDRLTLGRDVTFEIPGSGRLVIGDSVTLSDRVVLSTLSTITLGNWVSIAENTGIRGSFHQLKAGVLAVKQPSDTTPITIGEGVGIGANCNILLGVTLPEGCIIGANSVVTSSTECVANGIYAGIPARLLRMRE